MKKKSKKLIKIIVFIILFLMICIISILFINSEEKIPEIDESKTLEQEILDESKTLEQEKLEQEILDESKTLEQEKLEQEKLEQEILDESKTLEQEKQYLKEEDITAYHESGHTLITLAFGCLNEIDTVDINGTEKIKGLTSRTVEVKIQENNKIEDCFYIREILISLGGVASETLLAEKNKMDKNKVRISSSHDYFQINSYFQELNNKPTKSKNEFVEELLEESKKILKINKEILDEIAKKLIFKKTLNKKDLEKIIEEKGPINKVQILNNKLNYI